MKLIIGRDAIAKYLDAAIDNTKTEFAASHVVFHVQLDSGDYHPAMVVFELKDFDRIILPDGETWNRAKIKREGDRITGILETMGSDK